jgi:hypothetical protein
MGRDSSVGIATRYGLDGPAIESRWGARFSATVQTDPGAHLASCAMGTWSFQGVKRSGRGVDHPPHLAPLGLRGLFYGELFFCLYLYLMQRCALRLTSQINVVSPTLYIEYLHPCDFVTRAIQDYFIVGCPSVPGERIFNVKLSVCV